MTWQLVEHPLITAAYAVNLGVRVRRAVIGQKRHSGTAAEIIRARIDDCWDGTHYRASPGYFRQFWTRDLSFSGVALARLSAQNRTRVLASVEWAIRTCRQRRSHLTTTIHFFGRRPQLEPLFVRIVMPDYQGASVWTSLGSIYMQLLNSIDPGRAAAQIDRYRAWIERDGTFWEVIDQRTGRAYSSTLLTQSDESMLWSSIFLDLLEHRQLEPATLRDLR